MIKLSKNSVFHCLFVSDSYLNKFMDPVEVHSVFTLNLLERCIKETITSSTLLESVNAYNTVLHQEPFLQDKPCCLQKIHEYWLRKDCTSRQCSDIYFPHIRTFFAYCTQTNILLLGKNREISYAPWVFSWYLSPERLKWKYLLILECRRNPKIITLIARITEQQIMSNSILILSGYIIV